MDTSQRMFFVIGAPRSGTTLLMRMLNVHPEVYTRPEPHLLTPLAHLGFYAYVDKAPYDPFQSHEAVRAYVADLPGGERAYLDALRAYTDRMYGGMLEPTGKRYFVDKTPAYGLILPFLAKLYPDAVYVVLTRHPFAIFASYAESFFDGDWEAAHRFNPILERYVPALARFVREAPVPRLHHVRYADLVTDPERELRAICAVAGLDYDPAMIEYGRKNVEGQGLGDPIGVAAHDRPTTASVEKWAKQVDAPRRALLEAMLAKLDDEDLATLGFTRESVWEPLAGLDPAAVPKRRLKWDRHHLQRRVLLHLRRNIHENALGRALKRARFTLDVILRE
jgi:hypothetical protein